jgi:uncharacterized Fe-S cluster protein YjdI
MARELIWNSEVCIHSGNCVKTLPQVFKVENGKFVIDSSAADESRLKAAIAACPSGALKFKD